MVASSIATSDMPASHRNSLKRLAASASALKRTWTERDRRPADWSPVEPDIQALETGTMEWSDGGAGAAGFYRVVVTGE